MAFHVYDGNMFSMVIENIAVNDLSKKLTNDLNMFKGLIPLPMKDNIEKMLFVVKIMSDRLALNSKNSSIPPSQDPNRKKPKETKKKDKGKERKPGGQPGHEGTTLERVDNCDSILYLDPTPPFFHERMRRFFPNFAGHV